MDEVIDNVTDNVTNMVPENGLNMNNDNMNEMEFKPLTWWDKYQKYFIIGGGVIVGLVGLYMTYNISQGTQQVYSDVKELGEDIGEGIDTAVDATAYELYDVFPNTDIMQLFQRHELGTETDKSTAGLGNYCSVFKPCSSTGIAGGSPVPFIGENDRNNPQNLGCCNGVCKKKVGIGRCPPYNTTVEDSQEQVDNIVKQYMNNMGQMPII